MNNNWTNNADERLRILRMVEEGKVTADEGAALLGALGLERKPRHQLKQPSTGGGRWFRVRVSDLVTGKSKTTVNIPMGLVDWGLRIGAQFAPEVAEIDLDQVSEMLRTGVEGKIVDVLDEEDGEHVEIFID